MPDGGKGSRSSLRFVGAGFEIAVPVAVFGLVGHWADGRLGSEPWLLLTGGVLGIVVGMYGFIRRVLPPREPS